MFSWWGERREGVKRPHTGALKGTCCAFLSKDSTGQVAIAFFAPPSRRPGVSQTPQLFTRSNGTAAAPPAPPTLVSPLSLREQEGARERGYRIAIRGC